MSDDEIAARLTDRQRDVVRGLASSMTVKEIARELKLSPKTVEWHRGLAHRRIGLESRDLAGITRFAIRTKLVPP